MPSIYYNGCATGSQAPYNCNACPTIDYGRIRSVAYVKTSYVSTLILNPSLSSAWVTAITTGNAIVVWQTKGNYDGGSTSEQPGFGDQATSNGDTVHTLTYDDPNYTENCDFYNDIRPSSQWTGVYRTKNNIHFTENVITITPKNPVADDTNTPITWNVQWKWTNTDSPCPNTTPVGIFDTCYIYS